MNTTNKWTMADFSSAMKNAILSRADNKSISIRSGRVLFNGFWRNGDKQNVCAWLDKATWHDAKTGDGGGCKEFADTVFGMTLPEFMAQFGSANLINAKKSKPSLKIESRSTKISIHQIWLKLQQLDITTDNNAAKWLENNRGILSPHKTIGSGFANLSMEMANLFDPSQRGFIKHRISICDQMIVPIRGVQNDTVENFFIRALGEVDKNEKSRLLPDAGGWHSLDKSPRAFGFPHLIPEFSNLILCEGMADYFSAEYLLDCDHKSLPIGVPSAGSLSEWAHWLVQNAYKGKVCLVYQLDKENGKYSLNAAGPKYAVEALRILRNQNCNVQLFDWHTFLMSFRQHFDLARIFDLADVCKLVNENSVPFAAVSDSFIKTIDQGDSNSHA